MNRSHNPGNNHVTPEPGSKGWNRVLARGCGLVYFEMEGDYDCTHGYTWACEGCPVAMVKQPEEPDDPGLFQLV